MNQISKIEPKTSKFRTALLHVLDFVFSNAIGVSGLVLLAGFLMTDMFIYLKSAAFVSLGACFLFLLMTITALVKFGFKPVIAEMEINFLDLTMYSIFILGTLSLLTLELYN